MPLSKRRYRLSLQSKPKRTALFPSSEDELEALEEIENIDLELLIWL